MSERKCTQTGCDKPCIARFTWPGRDEAFACVSHALKLKSVAEAMGLHLQLLPLVAVQAAIDDIDNPMMGG